MAAVQSPQDVYARHLVSGRGYPLWTPEPDMSLPYSYLQEGLKIGDVGVVVPEDGSFDVFFNVTLPPAHILHQETGVPDNFTPILLGGRDIAVFPEAEGAGRVISTSSVTRVKNVDTADGDREGHVEPGLLNYQFTLSSREGAVLILPEGAERCYLRNERPFLEAAMQHVVDWYTFAEQQLGRIISHDSLYLITGFYKARSWSLAAYQQGAGTGEASAQFKAVQVGRGNIPACYTWETTQAMDWRVGPSDLYYNGKPNQTVFISGFKIAVRESILGSKRVTVKAGNPSVRQYHTEFSSGTWLSSLWGGVSGSSGDSTSNTAKRTGTSSNTDTNLLIEDQPCDDVHESIAIHRFPQVTKSFHPSDIINQHLLHEMPSATVAVTHDSQWMTLLQNGLLKSSELSQDRVIAEVTSNYIPMLTDKGAVYLESRAMEIDVGDDAKMAVMSSEHEGNLDLFPMSHDGQLFDTDLLTAEDTSVKPFACAYGNLTDPESSHAMYHTAHELQEHVTFAHADIVGPDMLVFRCGVAGCGQSWEHIEDLKFHIRSSNAHRQVVNSGDHANLLLAQTPESYRAPPSPAFAGHTGPEVLSHHTLRGSSSLSVPRCRIAQCCNPCKRRHIRCDTVRPVCGTCRRRSSPCTYDDYSVIGKDKKSTEPGHKLQLVNSLLSLKEPSGTQSCRRCEAQGLECRAGPGKACVACAKLSLRCEYKFHRTLQPDDASSSGGSKVSVNGIYRNKEGESFSMLGDIIKELTGQAPLTRYDVLSKATEELELEFRRQNKAQGSSSSPTWTP